MTALRKRITLALAACLVLAHHPIPSNAATVKVGQNCSKLNIEQKIGKLRVVCTKIDGRATWQPSIAQIQEGIWRDLQKQRSSLPDVSASLDVRFSPTVKVESAKLILNSLNQASTLWQVQYLPQEPLPTLFFTEKDRKWFAETVSGLGFYSESKLSQFDNEVSRNGNRANWAGITGDGGRLLMTYMIGTGRNTFDPNDAQVAAHEYTHLAQNGIASQHFLACWQIEGGASFYGLYLGAKNLKELSSFTKVRNNEPYYLGFSGLKKQSPQSLPKLIKQFSASYGDQKCGPDGAYPVGNVMHEYLYTLKGHQGIIEMLQNVAAEKSFTTGMDKTFGKPWPELQSEIVKYIKLLIAQSN